MRQRFDIVPGENNNRKLVRSPSLTVNKKNDQPPIVKNQYEEVISPEMKKFILELAEIVEQFVQDNMGAFNDEGIIAFPLFQIDDKRILSLGNLGTRLLQGSLRKKGLSCSLIANPENEEQKVLQLSKSVNAVA